MTILLTIAIYFALLMVVARLTGKSGNDAFFRGNRQSPWFVVAFGMIGASISGVTFVSVPGMVLSIDMTYMQMCIGFIFGYLIVAFVLLPLYYKHHLTSIYSYLGSRLGPRSYKTGASFFLLSKLTGAAARLYLVCLILQEAVLDDLGIPFMLTVVGILLLIWLYTRRSGIRTLVWTDTLQTFCMFAALILILWQAIRLLDMTAGEAVEAVANDPKSRIFEFEDWTSKQYFWKQFLSGVFIVVVMTGLDQDMMQKNLTCKNLHEAKKDVCSYGFMFVPANLLFLSSGVVMTLLYAKTSTPLPENPDHLLTAFITQGKMGNAAMVLFSIGIVASAFSSADSALTALTTSFCIDILGIERKGSLYSRHPEQTRQWVHIAMMIIFTLCILVFKAVNDTSVIDAVYTIAGYTYGPLLGLFAFGMFTRRPTKDQWVPFIAILSPLLCFAIERIAASLYDYHFGYELLMLNGMITFMGLCIGSMRYKCRIND